MRDGESLARELLLSILRRADAPNAGTFTADEVARWPTGAFACLSRIGLIREASAAQEVLCLECGVGCWIQPRIATDRKTGKLVGVYFCRRNPDVGRFNVDLARLRQWEFDAAGAAIALVGASGATGPVKELEPSRLYSLGTLSFAGRPRQAFFGRGLAWADGRSVIGRAAGSQDAASIFVFVPAQRPHFGFCDGPAPLVCPLTEVARVTDATLRLDLSVFFLSGDAKHGHVQNPISMRDFMEKYCLSLAEGRADQLAERIIQEARRVRPRLKLPPTTNKPKRNQKKYFLASDLCERWADYQQIIPSLPDLK